MVAYRFLTLISLGLGSHCASALQYGYNQVSTHKDSAVVAGAFPAINGTHLQSPAFTSPGTVPRGFSDGTSGPTRDETMEGFMRRLARSNSWMTYHEADFKSEEGRKFPYMYLSASKSSIENPSSHKLRVWLQGGVHGNEPAGDQSMLALLGDLAANQKWAAKLLEKMDILVLPRYNPDGVFYFQRYLATNFDPNRDHIKLARQQTRDIKELFVRFSPHIATDMHEFTAGRAFGPKKDIIYAADALFSSAKNLNIDEGIRQLSEKLFAKRMGKDIEAAGLRWDPYITQGESSSSKLLLREAGTDAKIGRNAMGLSQCVVFLCETRGIGIADQHFERRTLSGLVMVKSILQTAVDNFDEVYNTIERGIRRFTNSRNDIVLTDKSPIMERTFGMLNTTDATLFDYPIDFATTTPAQAVLTRSRPRAYLIPPSWPDIVKRLEVFGVKADKLPYSYVGPVEALNVTSVTFDKEYYEGVVTTTVETKLVERNIRLPAGSYLVKTNQKNAALAFVALEPENIDSFASFGVIPVSTGDQYPIFRLK
ncbi:Zinc carboxypeptidase [Trichophyton interdigitale]|uniref:Carboxypeptidase M14B n=1 Tax=Trichophyton interdigitale TaxID=101480 RepID=A0A9P4YMB3_9EURO|nr:Zinc carboxypeptidase [Trichophyton interdigitale]KAF3901284.1 Zinc carboxypeptidase [Trichophyton interdigitale]KAG8212374.1 Zinc carboxypeptidase [Trichophyton interdigitale]